MTAICIIPARGGSQRIRRKNIRVFADTGRTVLGIAVDLARSTGLFETIYVSSEDAEIQAAAKGAGACVLHRDPHYSQNNIGTQEVTRQALRSIMAHGKLDGVTTVCCLYPCTPLLMIEDIKAAHNMLQTYADKRGKWFVFGAVMSELRLSNCLFLDDSGSLKAHYRGDGVDPTFLYDAGQFYWGSRGAFLEGFDLYPNALPYVMPDHRAIDINYEQDWYHAELVHYGLTRGDIKGGN